MVLKTDRILCNSNKYFRFSLMWLLHVYMYVLFIWFLSSHQYLVYMYFLCDLLNMYTYQYMPKLRFLDVLSNVLADDFDLWPPVFSRAKALNVRTMKRPFDYDTNCIFLFFVLTDMLLRCGIMMRWRESKQWRNSQVGTTPLFFLYFLLY